MVISARECNGYIFVTYVSDEDTDFQLELEIDAFYSIFKISTDNYGVDFYVNSRLSSNSSMNM